MNIVSVSLVEIINYCIFFYPTNNFFDFVNLNILAINNININLNLLYIIAEIIFICFNLDIKFFSFAILCGFFNIKILLEQLITVIKKFKLFI